MSDEKTGFASRWSKRKIATLKDSSGEKPIDDAVQSDPAANEGRSADTSTGAELLTVEDFDDVDFEALDKSSDYTGFIKSNVPAAIQQKALRKLWQSDSVFEVLDGLNDYDEDFTGNGLAGKAIKTAYKVGRGFLEDENVEQGEDIQVADGEEKSEDAENIQNSENTVTIPADDKTVKT